MLYASPRVVQKACLEKELAAAAEFTRGAFAPTGDGVTGGFAPSPKRRSWPACCFRSRDQQVRGGE
jgi:hypothetical protein